MSAHRAHAPLYSPAAIALQNWRNQVSLLNADEQEEIDTVYTMLNALLHTYQSSAALAILRASLEIGQIQGQ